MITVGDILQRARDHDERFTVERHPDRPLVSHLSTQHRAWVKSLIEFLKDRHSEARTIADTINNALVGVDENGVAYSVQTSGDGYDVIVDAGGFCYTGPVAIASDPYTAGFVLPVSSLKIIDLYATMLDGGGRREIHVVPQLEYARQASMGTLAAIINGWRLIPLRSTAATDTSLWARVASVTVVWVDEPGRFATTGADWADQVLLLSDTYADALEYEVAAYLGRREAARDPAFAPIAQALAVEAERQAAAAREGARHDHRGIRFMQARRNR